MTNRLVEQQTEWKRATKTAPCEVCAAPKWCAHKPDVVLCMRVQSTRPAPGGGFLHARDGEAHRQNGHARAEREKRAIDWRPLQQRFAEQLTTERAAELAATLGVDAIAVRELGVGYDDEGGAWTIPMSGPDGAVCGIKTRDLEGNKFALPGSKLGVFRRASPTDASDGLLLICEGESDTLAALSLGFDALGVSGAGNCGEVVAAFVRDRDAVIVADDDEPGIAGAAKIANAIVKVARSVRTIRPVGCKDLRDWIRGGATPADLEKEIATAKPLSRGPIADAWKPLAPGLLSTQPPARRWIFRHPDRDGVPVDDRHGDGLMPAGKVELLVSAGGVGKTRAVIAAGVSLITGRKWFDHFDPDPDATGDVLLVLAEEDADEVHRRLFDVAQALNLTDAERREVERRLVVLPFAGISCAVATGSSDAELRATGFVDELLRQMVGRQWSLVVCDPLSRFAGVPIDVDNTNATFVQQQFERLAIATGAAVLIAHHSSKADRQQGRATARGASGIEDAARWVATLVAADDAVKFLQTKSNYSRPMREADAVVLVRERGGHLRVQTAAERAVLDGDATEQDIEAVVAGLRKIGGRTRTASAIAKASGGRKQDRLAAVEIAVAKGRIVREPEGVRPRDQEYVLPELSSARAHPHTPGNREPGFPGSADREPGSVPGTSGNQREPGTERSRRDLE